MNILIVSDKFKGSLTAAEVSDYLAKGLKESDLDSVSIDKVSMADGGDGTLEIIQKLLPQFEKIEMHTLDPLHRTITSWYLINEQKALIELALSSGIVHLQAHELDPMQTTTLGTGILIQDAIRRRCTEIILCLGGSCSTDAGFGILHSLGFEFLNEEGDILVPCGGNLQAIADIRMPDLPLTNFTILSDVDNPLYGLNGAAYVFGPQKGATEDQVKDLDGGLVHISEIVQKHFGRDISTVKGGGAAGGIAAGLHGVLNASITSGFDFLADLVSLKSHIENADIIITGEGYLDASSFQGKVPGRIVEFCKDAKKPVVLVCGGYDDAIRATLSNKTFAIMDIAENTDQAIKHAGSYLSIIGQKIGQYILSLQP